MMADHSGEPGTDIDATTVNGSDLTLQLPDDVDPTEAAAIASAVGAYLHDHAAGASDDDEPGRADAWKLAGRMKAVGKSRWPNDVREGEEWKAAARSFD